MISSLVNIFKVHDLRNKILFVIHNRRDLAMFNEQRDWRTAPPAPLDVGIARDSLYNIVTPRRGPGDI